MLKRLILIPKVFDKYFIIYFFSLFTILFTKFSRHFNGDIPCLDFLIYTFVGLDVSNSVWLSVSSGAGSDVGVLSG